MPTLAMEPCTWQSDLSDGFYWMFLDPAESLKLSVLMPHYEGELQLVAIPLSTTMG